MIETFIPTSSHLDRVDYDSDAKEMTITFKDGRAYTYSAVPFEKYLGLQNARSPGQYFHMQIESAHNYTEV